MLWCPMNDTLLPFRQNLVIENETEFIRGKFNFQHNHKGFRPGKIHLLVGGPGSGKTTLVRAIIGHVALKHKTLLWLSEESRKDLLTGLTYQNVDQSIFTNLIIHSEVDTPPSTNFKQYQSDMEELIISHNPDVIFFDNITTCQSYESNGFERQGTYITWLKQLTLKRGFALFIVAHTNSTVKENANILIDQNDIRGSKSLVNNAEYLYIFQRVRLEKGSLPFVRVQKSRGHLNDGFYLLDFSTVQKTYVRDKQIPWEEIKKVFSERAKL